MTPNMSLFEKYTPAEKAADIPASVQVADGSSALVAGVGLVSVSTVVTGGTVVRHTLKSVLHVPGLQQNLFSVSRFSGMETTAPRLTYMNVHDDVCEMSWRFAVQPQSPLKWIAVAELCVLDPGCPQQP
jgi:hypothetical protein